MNHINKDYEINVPPSPSLAPIFSRYEHPRATSAGPPAGFLGSSTLKACSWSLAASADSLSTFPFGPINTVIDALWDLEERLRYCLHLHCEAQRSFTKKHANSSPANQIPKDLCRAAVLLRFGY
jgi:hypothetical protein